MDCRGKGVYPSLALVLSLPVRQWLSAFAGAGAVQWCGEGKWFEKGQNRVIFFFI